MKSLAPVYAIMAVIVAVMIAGAAFVLLYDGSYRADISRDGGTVGYSVGSAGADTYSILALSGQGPDSVVIYADEAYGYRIEQAELPVGSSPLTPLRFAKELSAVLKVRGYGSVTIVGAGELSDIVSDPSSASGKAIVCASGALPDTVYDGTADSGIIQWIGAGGTLYWAGNTIGLYSGAADGGVAEHGGGPSLFLGGRGWCPDEGAFCIGTDGDVTDILGLRGTGIRFAPEHGAGTYTTGYTDGRYSTVTFMELGAGQICIVAGELHYDHYRNLAQLICSGMSYGSEVLGYANGTVIRSTVGGSIELSDPSADATVYVFMGKGADAPVYGCTFRTVA